MSHNKFQKKNTSRENLRVIKKVSSGHLVDQRYENKAAKADEFSRFNSKSDKIKKITQPRVKCTICGQEISQIEMSLATNINQNEQMQKSRNVEDCLCHFDCALKFIRQKYNVVPPLKVSYIGKGNFAIVKKGKKESDFSFVQVVSFENSDDHLAIQKYIEGLKG